MGVWARARIRTKLLAMLLAVGLGGVALAGAIGFGLGRESIERSVFEHLTAVRAAKAREIEGYMARTRAQVVSLAQGSRVLASLRGFKNGVAQLRHASPNPRVR